MQVLITRVGDSAALVIPKKVALLLGFGPGMTVRAPFKEGGSELELRVREFSRVSLGVLLPAKFMREQGWAIGVEIDVPFLLWRSINGQPAPKRAKKATPKKAAKKAADGHDGPAAASRRPAPSDKSGKKSPRAHGHGPRGGDEAYARSLEWESRLFV